MKRSRTKSRNIQASDDRMVASLEDQLRNQLHEFIISTGMDTLQTLLEAERAAICGPRYGRGGDYEAHRSGTARGELVMGGRRVAVRRPRARNVDGEVMLPSWARFRQEDPLEERAVEQMVVGVSTRKYKRSLESTPKAVDTRGTSKSAVSRRFVAATSAKMKAWMSRDLSCEDFAAVMIDGVHFSDHVILVALGVTHEGKKSVLGLWEGHTENTAATKALLRNLVDRGVDAERSLLFVIDGSKALRKAIRDFFGERGLVQRCRAHKRRNVRDHLPVEQHASVRSAMDAAYRLKDAAKSERLLENYARRIQGDHPGAAASLREGLEETLTVKRHGIGGNLERFLSTTNAVENLIGSGRRVTKRVKRWRGGEMVLRWMCTAMEEATRGFRKVLGYKDMHKLVAALEKNDRRLDVIDRKQRVA